MSKLKTSHNLTNREIEILHLLAEGWSNQHIASTMGLTIRTVKYHTGNIYSRIEVKSRSEAIVWAWKHNELHN